tara:strand:+ start:1124 stop:1906 length:783 start_codon:yes stop_codon:yes gene_type:complete
MSIKDNFDLKKKIIILTGANGFLAKNFINEILKYNGKLILIDKDKLHVKKNKNLFFFKCDLSNESKVKKVFKSIKTKIGVPDILINNAAMNPSIKNIKKNDFSLENFSKNYWEKDIAHSLTTAFLCTKYFGKIQSSKKRCILNISSDLGLIAPNQEIYKNKKNSFYKPVSYSVVKHGIIGLTKYTSTFWCKKNIRCNAVAFGGVYKNQNKNFVNKLSKLIPIGRMAQQDEYNSTLIYLISDASSYMNGAVLVVDGGRTAW